MMNPEIKTKWLAALRSGEYEQGHGVLRKTYPAWGVTQHCCLGVLCELHSKETNKPWHSDYYFGIRHFLPDQVAVWADVNDELSSNLMHMNDNDGASFAAIADYIEEIA